jgi:hypothetical protein
LQGETKFGPADAATRAAIESIHEVARLEKLAVRLMNADSWQKVVPPQARRRKPRS